VADVINLRRARKAKARTEREAKAVENRAKHGRSKQERRSDAAEQHRLEHALEGHRRGAAEKEPDQT
jgi:hypothetical protein